MSKKETYGRPTKYLSVFDDHARKFCLLGATDKDLANFFNVSLRTINQWKKEHPSFKEALSEGKVVADANVAASLYKRATGTTVKIEKACIDKQGIPHVVAVTEELPGDVHAQRFWLNNRRPKEWREKHSIDLDFSNMTDDQLDQIINKLIEKQNDNTKQNAKN